VGEGDGIKRAPNGQWLPGTVGGPGRPKGSLSLVSAIKRKLANEPNLEDRVADALFQLALDGDHRALASIKELIDRVDGAVTKRQDIHFGAEKIKVVRLAGDEDDEDGEGLEVEEEEDPVSD
jgi:hypothetical protein